MIKIVCVGKIKNTNLKNLIDDYLNKINHYHKIEIIEIKDESIDKNKDVLSIEGNKILNKINNDEYIIALDLKGKEYDSLSFAYKLDKLFINHSNISFIIGGSLGLSDEVKNRANELLKLSEFTFLHQMSRLIILEQIYRSFKINNNEVYHR